MAGLPLPFLCYPRHLPGASSSSLKISGWTITINMPSMSFVHGQFLAVSSVAFTSQCLSLVLIIGLPLCKFKLSSLKSSQSPHPELYTFQQWQFPDHLHLNREVMQHGPFLLCFFLHLIPTLSPPSLDSTTLRHSWAFSQRSVSRAALCMFYREKMCEGYLLGTKLEFHWYCDY